MLVAPPPITNELNVNFILTIKIGGKAVKELTLACNGHNRDAYLRARTVTARLSRLFPDKKFTTRISRPDRPAATYEIGPDGHTIN